MSVITGGISISSTIVDTLAAGALRPVATQVNLAITHARTYSDGSAAGMVSRAYYFSGTATATPTTINLSTIVGTDGGVGFTHIREIIVINDATVDGSTLIVGGGTTPFNPDAGGTTPTTTVQAGASKRYVSKPLGTTGHAVSTNVNLKIDPSAATVAFRVLILGTGA